MSNRLTAKDYKRVLMDVISNGYHHIQAINNEIQQMKIEDPKSATQSEQDKLRALTLTMTLVNDLIHPAHKISKEMLKGKDELIDYCMRMQKIAFQNKLIDECYCSVCKSEDVANDIQ